MSRKTLAISWALVFLIQVPTLAPYLWELSANPCYAWLIVPIGFVTGLLVAWRWDWRLGEPNSRLSLTLLVAGMVASAIAGVLGLRWFAMFGFMLTSGGFLSAQRDRFTDRSLLTIWPVLWGVMRLPLNGFSVVQAFCTELIEATAVNILRLLEIAHLPGEHAVILATTRLYFDDVLFGFTGWPLFVALVLMHCAIHRRHWAVVGFDVLAAIGVCMIFHCSVVLWQAYAEFGGGGTEPSLLVIQLICGMGACLLFLSAERGIRGLLAPVADGTEESRQANPLVMGWNLLLHGETNRMRKRKSASKADFSTKTMLLVIYGLVVLNVANLRHLPSLRGLPVENVRWEPSPALLNEAWATYTVDHRDVPHSIRDEWKGEAAVWTFYSAKRISEFVVEKESSGWREVEIGYLDDWDIAQQSQVVTPRETQKDDKLSFVSVELERDGADAAFAVLFYAAVSPAGECMYSPESADQDGFMIQEFSILFQKPDAETTQRLAAEFAALLQTTASQIGSQSLQSTQASSTQATSTQLSLERVGLSERALASPRRY